MNRSKSSFSATQHFHFHWLLKLRLETASNTASELWHQQVSGINKLFKSRNHFIEKKNQIKARATVATIRVTHLRTYSGEKLKPLCVMDATVEHNKQSALCQLYFVGTTDLFGRSWLKEITIDWQNIRNIMHVSTVKTNR